MLKLPVFYMDTFFFKVGNKAVSRKKYASCISKWLIKSLLLYMKGKIQINSWLQEGETTSVAIDSHIIYTSIVHHDSFLASVY